VDGRCGVVSCREMKVRLREDGLRDGFWQERQNRETGSGKMSKQRFVYQQITK
jgi:hypothetical protein